MKVLITGITGMVGSHLAEHLLSRGDVEVHGTLRVRSPRENIAGIEGKVVLHECELRDARSVEALLSSVRPDRIFHLAAQSFVPTSWNAPSDTIVNNVVPQVNLFESMVRLGLKETRFQIACSSEEYGMVLPHETPITETNPLRPLSPYAVSKVTQDYLGYQYHQSYGLFTVRTRGFNHTGPRRGQVFVTSNFARQVALIEAGRQEPVISVGNLDARRDFTDVRDMVRGYVAALEKCEPGEVYNICSGKDYAISEIVDILLSLTDRQIEIRPDPARMRPSDVQILLGDRTKFTDATGWEPTIPFATTMSDLLDYWRRKVGAGAAV